MANNGPFNDRPDYAQLQKLQLQDIKNQTYINKLSSAPLTLTNPTTKPGRPLGSKTKDKEVIIQETVDRLIDQVVKLLTKHNFDEDRLNDADITVDEKANYAFVTVTVGLPNGSIISVSERVKVANKTDPIKNWQILNQAFYAASAKKVAQKVDEDMSNIFIATDPEIDSTSNDF